MFSALIADCNRPYAEELKAELLATRMVSRVKIVSDGLAAVETIRNESFDALLLDTVLTGIDGIEVLNRIIDFPHVGRMALFVNSSVISERVLDLCSTYPLNYMFLKPNLPAVVAARVAELSTIPGECKKLFKDIAEADLLDIITQDLLSLGLFVNMRGYLFARTAIQYAARRNDEIISITKDIYSSVAARYDATVSQVERNIRTAINTAWDSRSIARQQALFGFTIDANRGSPSNAEFILMLADRAVRGLQRKLFTDNAK